MAKYLSAAQLETLDTLHAHQLRDKYLPPAVQQRNREIRQLIDEVKMWRESAGEETLT
jgi:hypothetical protein